MTSATDPEGPEGDRSGAPDPNLEALLDSFAERLRRGERPSVSEYAAKYPKLGQDIRDLFPAQELVERVKGEPRGPADLVPAAAESSGVATVRIGEYRLIREIGRGGMGVVYEAEQESLARRVAVKVLPFHARMDRQYVERFRREARAAANLEHPNIVPVYGLHEERGIYYYVMRYVDGAGLDAVLKTLTQLRGCKAPRAPGELVPPTDEPSSSIALSLLSNSFPGTASSPGTNRLPERQEGLLPAPVSSVASAVKVPEPFASRGQIPRDYYLGVARIASQAAEALACAHEQGILHRDIKPSNLLLDVRGKIWVADFGLAKSLGSEDLTATGCLVGTLRYMAPERLDGQTDARSDIYSLGLALQELLTLERPFPGQAEIDLLRRIREERLPAPSEINPETPGPLNLIAQKATARDPAQRYASAADLAGDLQRFLDGKSVRARRPRKSWKLGASLKRRPLRTALAAVLLAILAAACAWWWTPKQFLLPTDFALGDFDGDARIDIAVTGYLGPDDAFPGSVFLFRNEGGGRFRGGDRFLAGPFLYGVAAADLDGDGNCDLAVTSRNAREVQVYLNRDHGSFTSGSRIGFNNIPLSLIAADLDGDGRKDLVVNFLAADTLALLRNEGGSFAEAAQIQTGGGPFMMDAADMNRDGALDLVTSNVRAGSLSVILKKPDGSFQGTHYPLADYPWGFAIADFDGDGGPDVAVTHVNSGGLTTLRNDGDGKLSPWQTYSFTFRIESLAAGDFNGDGSIDLVGAGDEAFLGFFKNLGDGTFDAPQSIGGAEKSGLVRAADLDGDGDLDLVLMNGVPQGRLSILRNEGGGVFKPVDPLSLSYHRFPWGRP